VEGGYDLILTSAILEHIPDAPNAIRQVIARARRCAYMYARPPFVLPLAQIIRLIDTTYPGHVHNMGSVFRGRLIETFGMTGRMHSSGPLLVEATFAGVPPRKLRAHALKASAMLEQALLGQSRTPGWRLVG
jgi:hypothetical protein